MAQLEPTQEDIAAGARLSVILQPDHETLNVSTPTYDETYQLPFVYSQDGVFTGVTRPAHAVTTPTKEVQCIGFGYTNALPVYSIYYPGSVHLPDTPNGKIVARVISAKQYKVMKFAALPAGRLLYEATETARGDHGPVCESIANGRKHYAVADFGDGSVKSLPIDISYSYFSSDRLEFRTETFPISSHLTKPKRFSDDLRSALSEKGIEPENPNFYFGQHFDLAWTFYHFFEDGSYSDTPGDTDQNRGSYTSLRIYEYP
ncbi:hypothetical protein HH303_16210 [Rhodospirillaceae bacterium KN72]|uniref:Uncharacterized protein n=1 Tax=Pacificispira spongiicola TaxID=2729598 RepID=A0A7Y0HFN3_9PROT|nr:hypothetical protein [Pacificispira spongiicola]NMM46041.1 hypothetical protein [Pacificispira spongiicola]